MIAYDVLSPDGISIGHDYYPTRLAAEAALDQWITRYHWQGFYSTSRWERIPIRELWGRCQIVEFDNADWVDEDEEEREQ